MATTEYKKTILDVLEREYEAEYDHDKTSEETAKLRRVLVKFIKLNLKWIERYSAFENIKRIEGKR